MRRRLALSLLMMLCPAALAQNAATFRGDAAHTGVYDAPGIAAFHKIKWQFHTGGQILSSPVVVSDTVYFGSNDHQLYAVDLATGAEKWKFKTGGRVASTPAVANGLVFFLSYDSNFYALEAATGGLKWKFATAGEHRFSAKHLHGMEPAAEIMPDPFDFFLSSPVVSRGVVYFGSGDSNVYALDAATGTLQWKFKTGDVVHSSPAIADETLFIGSWDTYLYALDAATGKEKWRFKTGEDHEIFNQVGIQASPAVANGVVYFGCRDSKFYAVDAASGKQIWTFSNKGSWVINSAAIHDDKVYFATSDTGLVRALDAHTGAELYTIEYNHWPMFSSPAIAGNMLYLGSHQGRLLAIDLASRKPAWAFETDASKNNGPGLTDSKGAPNYAVAFKDSFYDDIVAGIQKMFSNGTILSSPAVSGGTVLFGSADGNLYAIM
jgi:eukaryotic-like serine/threonine-protein kinase